MTHFAHVTRNDNQHVQLGVVNGDAVFHRHCTTYRVSNEDGPRRRFDVAKNHLTGNSPRIAESLLQDCIRMDLANGEVAYYYALATLSEWSFDELGRAEFEHIRTALSIAYQGSRDEWYHAISVIDELLRCVAEQETRREPDPHTLTAVVNRFANLEQPRQEEIARHLGMIIDGAVRDQVDRVMAATVEQERFSGDRADRAWKFFQPEPTEPQPATPYFTGPPSAGTWGPLMLGTLGFVSFVGLLGVFHSLSMFSAVSMLLVSLACAATVWFGGHAVGARARRKRLEFELGDGLRRGYGNEKPDHLGSPLFRQRIKRMVSRQLDGQRPSIQQERSLIARLVRTYGKPLPETEKDDTRFRQRRSEVDPVTLNWLIDAQLREWSRQRADGTLLAFRKITRAELLHRILAMLSALLGGYAVYGIFGGLDGVLAAMWICVCIAAAAVVGTWGWARLLGHRIASARERADCWDRLEWELNEYRGWLADRPTDAEMARWLAFDKAYLKSEAMRLANLTNGEIVGHLVLTEGLPRSQRARVIRGLPRYSDYRALIFLLTDNGVRAFRVDLDFTDGSVRNWQATSFRYESLVGVRVIEVGVRWDDDRRQIIVIKDHHTTAVPDSGQGLVISRAVSLSLTNQDDIHLVLENFAGIHDEATEDKGLLDQLALDASVPTGAMRILESVAGEGRDRITKQRQRRDRRPREWLPDGRRRHEPPAPPPAAVTEPIHQGPPIPPVLPPQPDPGKPAGRVPTAAGKLLITTPPRPSVWPTDYPRKE